MPPVLNSFADQDSRVRYYACEALYNIAKVICLAELFVYRLMIIFVLMLVMIRIFCW